MKTKYVYFISYYFINDKSMGFGNCTYETFKKINSQNDITTINKLITEKEKAINGIISNFILLRKEKTND